MTIIRWKQRPMRHNLLDEMLERGFSTGFEKKCGCVPATNILEKEESYEIELAAPGMKKEDFKLEVEKNVLSVVFEKEETEKKEEVEYLQREFEMDGFTRSFTIPETADVENIKARYENGILFIHIPKMEKARLSREIKIS